MDLRRHLLVVWRFRRLVVGGFMLAVVVAVLASFQVSSSGLTWRSSQTFTATSTLFVTQTGFPWGRVTLPEASLSPSTAGAPANEGTAADTGGDRREYGAPERFSDLAVVYSFIARSDQVRELVMPLPQPDQIVITPVINPTTGAALPLLLTETHATDQRTAMRLNQGVIEALRTYLAKEQEASDIPESQRVRVQVLNPATPVGVTEGRTYMGSVVAFVLVMAAAIALAYLLENLRASRPAHMESSWAGNGHGNGNGSALREDDFDGIALEGEWLRPGSAEPQAEPSRRGT
jgi:hypothetical protein